MPLRLVIEEDEGFYMYMFVFELVDCLELEVYIEYNLDISRYERSERS